MALAHLQKLAGAVTLLQCGFEPATKSGLHKKLQNIQCNGSTAFRDSVIAGTKMMLDLYKEISALDQEDEWKLVHIIITDGEDTVSKISKEDLLKFNLLVNQRLPEKVLKTVYIGIDLENNKSALEELVGLHLTGGESTELHNVTGKQLGDLFQKIQVGLGIRIQERQMAIQGNGGALVIGQRRAQPVLQVQRNKFVVLFNMDCSGSMSGGRWNQLTQAVEKFMGSLQNDDLVCGLVFNDKVRKI